jgi:hypothetical protein
VSIGAYLGSCKFVNGIRENDWEPAVVKINLAIQTAIWTQIANILGHLVPQLIPLADGSGGILSPVNLATPSDFVISSPFDAAEAAE